MTSGVLDMCDYCKYLLQRMADARDLDEQEQRRLEYEAHHADCPDCRLIACDDE
jgi:hypothetical protein